MTYEARRQWADGYEEAIIRILKQNAMHLLSIERAPEDEDRKHATDMIVRVEGGDVAIRVRNGKAGRFSDLTLRSWLASGAKTELAKLREGFARWYLYGWDDGGDGRLTRWMLLDVDRLRLSGLLEKPKETMNRDGQTAFVIIPVDGLQVQCCLIASSGLALTAPLL